jgi:hypothetical protein
VWCGLLRAVSNQQASTGRTASRTAVKAYIYLYVVVYGQERGPLPVPRGARCAAADNAVHRKVDTRLTASHRNAER